MTIEYRALPPGYKAIVRAKEGEAQAYAIPIGFSAGNEQFVPLDELPFDDINNALRAAWERLEQRDNGIYAAVERECTTCRGSGLVEFRDTAESCLTCNRDGTTLELVACEDQWDIDERARQHEVSVSDEVKALLHLWPEVAAFLRTDGDTATIIGGEHELVE